MNTVKHRLRLDLSAYEGGETVYVKRGDDLSHELVVSFRNGREAYHITEDTKAYLYAYSDEGDRLLEECAVVDNEVRVLLKASMLQRSEVTLDLRLVGDKGAILGTPSVRVVTVENEIMESTGEDITELDEYTALLQAIRKAEDSAISTVNIENGELIVTYGNGSKHNAGKAVGEKGENGADGTIWHSGTAITGTGEEIMMPVSGAKAGDFYLNTDTGELYVATLSGEWWKYITTLRTGDGSYTKAEIDAIMGSYVNDIDALIGGDA